MKTIKKAFTSFKKKLNKLYDERETEAITLLAISEITNLSKAKIKAFPEQEISSKHIKILRDILNQLITGKPIQYVLGKTEFYGLPFNVNPSVLIPRPETEELVEWAIESVINSQWTSGNILDIGTGSGCIAISLKKNLTGFKVAGIDISAEALKTAKENADLNEVDVEFIEGNILNPVSLSQISNLKPQISLIISNPPYVTLHDKTKMHANVTDFEPHTALFVPEDDPLLFYKAIADFVMIYHAKKSMLFFEINENLGADTVDLLKGKGFKYVELRKDLSGRDRMIKAIV